MTDPLKSIDITKDWLLNERVVLNQKAQGYRAGLDAVLLAAALEVKAGASVLEAGCGAGAALMCAAYRNPETHFTGLEKDEDSVCLAQQNVAENGFKKRVVIIKGDVAHRTNENLNAFDQVFTNPPFFEPGSIQTVSQGKEAAYLAQTPLVDWLKFLLHTVRPKGAVTIIHRAAALADILEFMNSRFGEICVLPIRPYEDAPAKRILVRGRKGLRKGDVKLLSGLTLYEGPDRQLSKRATDIMNGEALEWR